MKPIALLAILCFAGWSLAAAPPATQKSAGDRMLDAYFRAESANIAAHCMADIKTLEDWTSRREEYRRQLAEMLGLWPTPPRTDLKPVITGTLDHGDFTVEKLHFQSCPGLYVTANLYVPKNLAAPAPAILYVCGHSPVKKDGISYGNKTAYQHHGAWFARNGYVCLIPDSLEFGEIDGIHHGLYRLEMWDWLSRGYTPAGVEAWNSIRCLDYLQSRPEVDPQRLGMTGRSGGGAYTWFTAALDERVKVAVPVAGITDITNHVVDGTVEGHCDCMFMINTYRWDFAQVAALIAPRPMLISNSDKDTIFPLDGVVRLHSKVRDIYKLYKADDKLGLLITEGPHKDTQDLQVPAFRWFNRFLKNDTSDLKDALTQNIFEPHELRVFPVHGEPADSINMMIQETFVPIAPPPQVPESPEAWGRMRDAWLKDLREKTFGGWPQSAPEAQTTELFSQPGSNGWRLRGYEFTSQEGVRLRFLVLREDGKRAKSVNITVTDDDVWRDDVTAMRASFPDLPRDWGGYAIANDPKDPKQPFSVPLPLGEGRVTVFFAPRGVGPTMFGGDAKAMTHIRRRFALLGQTLDGMRVWDVRRAVQAVRGLDGLADATIALNADGKMAGIALYAALFEAPGTVLLLQDLPAAHRKGPDLLNVLKTVDLPTAATLAAERGIVRLSIKRDGDDEAWAYPWKVGAQLGWPKGRIQHMPPRKEP